MALGVSRHPNTEIVVRADECHQFIGISKPILRFLEFLLPLRWIASQCQNILNALRLQGIQNGGDVFPIASHASQMGHRFQPDFAFDPAYEVDGFGSGTATGAESHGDIGGLAGLQLRYGGEQFVEPLVVLGREKFEGK